MDQNTYVRSALTISIAFAISACGGNDSGTPAGLLFTEIVPRVIACATGDQPETGLQGQVPAALRAAGFKGFNCNIDLVGKLQGEGGNWSSATFKDKAGNRCAYHSTATPPANVATGGRQNPGVPVINITDPANPVRTMSLTTKAMLDPWESLRVANSRQLLVAVNGTQSVGGPEVDVYDLSQDCRTPQLMSSVALTDSTGDSAASDKPINGHEGNISPDGLTYYVGDYTSGLYHAVDITNPTRPKVIATFNMKTSSPIGKVAHGLSISEDGKRVYAVAIGPTGEPVSPTNLADPKFAENGFLVLDTTQVQARAPNPQMRLVSATTFRDGTYAQHTIETKVGGKPYMVMVDEGGSAGSGNAANAKNACLVGLAPFPMARIYDMADEKNPKVISKLGLETHDPKKCDTVLPDIVGLGIFTYGSHYCSVDNRQNATAMACSYFNSGIRVFDIRKPAEPKEIAYFNPPSASSVPGSNHAAFGQWRAGGPDWCASRLDFDKETGTLTTMCQDNGLLVMKFKNGVWPFNESVASTLQN